MDYSKHLEQNYEVQNKTSTGSYTHINRSNKLRSFGTAVIRRYFFSREYWSVRQTRLIQIDYSQRLIVCSFATIAKHNNTINYLCIVPRY